MLPNSDLYTSLPSPSSAMAPKPLFFIIRPGQEQITSKGQLITEPRSIVPLIPVDLLPPWVVVEGLPSQLTTEDTAGMTNLGSFHKENESFQLRFLSVEQEEGEQLEPADDTDASTISGSEPEEASPQHISSPETSNASPEASPSQPQPKPQPQPQSKPRAPQGLACSRHNPQNNTPPSHQLPTTSPARQSIAKPKLSAPTTYCRHWCNHGTCKWGIACKFTHEMPTTLEGLCSVGLTDYPTWWRTATALAMGIPLNGRRNGKRRRQKRVPLVEQSRNWVGGRREVEDKDDEKENVKVANKKAAASKEENLIEI